MSKEIASIDQWIVIDVFMPKNEVECCMCRSRDWFIEPTSNCFSRSSE
jgi:hypothetical protein